MTFSWHLPHRLSSQVYPGPRPTIVLLHGIASSKEVWHNLLPLIESDYKVITIDLLGFGDSPKPQSGRYDADEHTQSIHWTLLRAGIRGPVIMAGHSMGALLAVHYATKYPRGIKGLILCSMPLYNGDAISRRLLDSWVKNSSNLYMMTYRRVRANPELTLKGARILGKIIPPKAAFELDAQTWYPFCQSLEHTIEGQNTSAELKQLKVPVQLLYGQFDGLLIHPYLTELARRDSRFTIRSLPCSHHINSVYARAIKAAIRASYASV